MRSREMRFKELSVGDAFITITKKGARLWFKTHLGAERFHLNNASGQSTLAQVPQSYASSMGDSVDFSPNRKVIPILAIAL